MKEAFRRLEAGRREEVLTAAMKEFAENGFEKASTNRIVKDAGMSKGMLYYYFENKEDLFRDCLGYALDHVERHMAGWFGPEHDGFIEMMATVADSKLRYFDEFPEITEFVAMLYLSPEVPDEYKQRLKTMGEEGAAQMFAGIDQSRFRDDLPPEVLIRLVKWTFDGYSKEMEERMKAEGVDLADMDRYWKEFDLYLDAMKVIYYKGE